MEDESDDRDDDDDANATTISFVRASNAPRRKSFSFKRLFCVDDDDDKRKAVMSNALNCVREEDMYVWL